jgi:tRNA threonylcarbamoyladenosine biosynthesis protein TsaE
MVTCISHSVADTTALGAEWARAAQAGWLIGLIGDLGAGKTQLVKGLAQGLGASDRVHSPTFTLVNEYRGGRLPLYHVDLYRLETPERLRSAGLDEYFSQTDGVTVVEWFDQWPEEAWPQQPLSEGLPAGVPAGRSVGGGALQRLRKVVLEVLSDTQRRISYEDFGA